MKIRISPLTQCAVWRMMSVALAALMTITVACSDDGAPALRPVLPATTGAPVRGIEHLGEVNSAYDWTFGYDNGRLTRATGVVRDADETIDRTYHYTSYIDYGPGAVWVNNSGGEKTSVSLNSQGLIERMTVNRNIYEFWYSDGRLVGWNKVVFENSFGQAMQYRSNATIAYLNGDITSITYTEADGRPTTLTFTPSNIVNHNGLLPAAVSKEMGCLSFEHLYYAGLLGRSTAHLVKSVRVERDGDDGYTLDFEYGLRGNNVVLCSYHQPGGKLSSVSYAY